MTPVVSVSTFIVLFYSR